MTNREAALKAATEWLEEISTEQRLGFEAERRAREDLRDLLLAQRREAKIEVLQGLKELYEEAPVVGIALFDVRDRIEAEIARAAREEP